jgi:protein-L-isoaspartate(D-aspartate) O-methyltransferase
VAAAAPNVPPPLIAQLREGGRLVIPVGDYHDQELVVIVKEAAGLRTRISTRCRFVPLRGHEGWR